MFLFLEAYGALKAVVEKGSLKLANMQGLVGPKLLGKPFFQWRKGIRLIFLNYLFWMLRLRSRLRFQVLLVKVQENYLFFITVLLIVSTFIFNSGNELIREGVEPSSNSSVF